MSENDANQNTGTDQDETLEDTEGHAIPQSARPPKESMNDLEATPPGESPSDGAKPYKK